MKSRDFTRENWNEISVPYAHAKNLSTYMVRLREQSNHCCLAAAGDF